MDAITLYYTFSTYAQVVSAIVAIIAVFVHFRIKAVQDLLIGHGQSVLNRWGEDGYRLPEGDELQRKRLIDAIGRRSISEIEGVIRLLRDGEIGQGHTLKDRPGGLQNLYDQRFRSTERLFQYLRSQTAIVVSAAFGRLRLRSSA